MAYSTLLQPEGLEQRYERYKEKIKYFTDSKNIILVFYLSTDEISRRKHIPGKSHSNFKSTACSEDISVMEFYLLVLTLYSCDGLSTMLTFFKFH